MPKTFWVITECQRKLWVNHRVLKKIGDHRVPKKNILGHSMDEEPGAKGWENHIEALGEAH